MTGGAKAKRRKRRQSHSANRGGKRRRLLHDIKPEDDCSNGKGYCNQEVVVFQDSAHSFLASQSKGKRSSSETDPASIFFELANSHLIGYRASNNKMIVIRQDNNCAIHTGGIVWETSYLLAEFLHEKYKHESRNKSLHPLGNTLEIGAGCGMLGLVLATKGLSSKVVLTEASEVMANLKVNVDENIYPDKNTQPKDETKLQKQGIHGTIYEPACPRNRASVRQLRWDHLKTDIKAAAIGSADASRGKSCNELEPHSFDTIVGTDVVFSPSLVCPLLKTIKKMARKASKSKASRGKDGMTQLSPKAALIYLCLQIRCPDSHALLFTEAPKYGLEVIDISEELTNSKCSWGLDLECVILKINVLSKKCK